MTNQGIGNFTPPTNPAKRPLSAEATDQFYNAACEMGNLQNELSGRVLLDFGLRVGELTHMTQSWIEKETHPRTGEGDWRIKVPPGERCVGGVGETGEGNNAGADLHDTQEPCEKCRTRDYQNKDWVDDQFHQQYPFHPKTANSIGKTWALPTESCEETAKLLHDFLAPDRQWPVLRQSVDRSLTKIRKKAGLNREVKPHALRHTYGCRLAAAGKNIQSIMSQMRHGDVSMAVYYSELRGTRHRDQIRNSWDATEDF